MQPPASAPRGPSWLRARWWEILVAVLVICLAIIYALPSLYPSQPSLQLSANTAEAEVNQALLVRVGRLLDSQGIPHLDSKLVKSSNGRSLGQLLFADTTSQLRARSIIARALGRDYVTAINTTPTIPAWLEAIGGKSISLGLDLRGGVHFLLQVDTQEVLNQRLEALDSELRKNLRQAGLGFIEITRSKSSELGVVNGLRVNFANQTDRDRARTLLTSVLGGFYSIANQGEAGLNFSLDETSIRTMESAAVEQNLVSLRNRVNELGVSEPLIQRQGRNRIVVELPGVQDTTQAKRIIGATANLEFRLEARNEDSNDQAITLGFRDEPTNLARLEKEVIVTGSNVVDAQAGFDENSRPQVNIELDGEGGGRMAAVTRNAVGRRMGAVFIEYKSRQQAGGDGEITTTRFIEKSIISLATIQSAFGNRFRITGLRDQFESVELALLLRAGSLAAPVYFVEERSIGASLGEENIRRGSMALVIGLALVALYMLLVYRVCGLFAIMALTINTLLVIASLAALSATLTLPGIAGLVLNLGMVVDANVLIFSRVREELNKGASVALALESGFSRAFATILDANLTTLLVAIILFAIGTGPIRGFAITLSLGIIGSLLCSVLLVRLAIKLVLGRRKQLSWIYI